MGILLSQFECDLICFAAVENQYTQYKGRVTENYGQGNDMISFTFSKITFVVNMENKLDHGR